MSTTKAYLIHLQPHERFFFGGDKTFGADNTYYSVKSRYLPQQTTLLGVLRYQILAAKGKLQFAGSKVTDATMAAEIGASSFNSRELNRQNFGGIERISHLFLKSGNTIWHPEQKDKGFTYRAITEGKACVNGKKNFIPHISDGYKAKNGITSNLSSNHGKVKKLEDFFEKHHQVGIGKSRKGKRKDQEKKFYKQTSYRFADPQMTFAFVAYLNSSTATALKNHLQHNPNVFMGGERGQFRMTMEEKKKEDINAFWKQALPSFDVSAGLNKLILLSDAYAKMQEVYGVCDFAVSEVISFQNINSSLTKTTNYYNLDTDQNDSSKVFKSNQINLLEKGSVFYGSAAQIDALAQVFRNAVSFRQIGYNAFVIVNTGMKTYFDSI